jgi:hypothetical protein
VKDLGPARGRSVVEEPAPPAAPGRLQRFGLPAAFWIVGLFLAYGPILVSGFRRMETNPTDTRFNNYVLEHGFRHLTGDPLHRDFWSPPIFYPHPNTAAYSDILLTVGPPYWLLRLVGFAPDTAFQLWMLVSSTLNFAAAYLLLSRPLKLTPLAAAAGAFLFSFASSRVAQTGHQQLLSHYFTALALYALVRLFAPSAERPSRLPAAAWVFVLSLSVTAQLYAGFYLGWFTVAGFAVAALWGLVLPECRRRALPVVRANMITFLASFVVAAALLVPMLTHYLAAAGEVSRRSFIDAYHTMPRWQSWLYTGPESWLYGWSAGLPVFSELQFPFEQRIGIGLVTSALGLAGLALHWRRPGVRLVLCAAASMVAGMLLLAAVPSLCEVYFEHVPGAYGVRMISRIGILFLIPAALGLALFLERQIGARRGVWLGGLLAAVCVLEQGRTVPSFDKLAKRREIAQLAAMVDPACRAFLLTPALGNTGKYNIDALWVQTVVRKPTINGFSGNQPPGWPFLDMPIRDAVDERQVGAALRGWEQKHGIPPESVCWVRVPQSTESQP